MEVIRDSFPQLLTVWQFAVIFGLIVLMPKLAERISLIGSVGLRIRSNSATGI
jgi:hypothetical protein